MRIYIFTGLFVFLLSAIGCAPKVTYTCIIGDCQDGQGIRIASNGERYTGRFFEGKPSKSGRLETENGYFEGFFDNGKLVTGEFKETIGGVTKEGTLRERRIEKAKTYFKDFTFIEDNTDHSNPKLEIISKDGTINYKGGGTSGRITIKNKDSVNIYSLELKGQKLYLNRVIIEDGKETKVELEQNEFNDERQKTGAFLEKSLKEIEGLGKSSFY